MFKANKNEIMKKSMFLFTSLIFLVITSCKTDDTNSSSNSENCYLNSNVQTMVHNGINRDYILYIPSTYNGTSAVPVLFNFHGFGGRVSDYISYADMRTEAESNAFILVYPQGSCLDGASHWNACPTGDDNKSNADDFGFIESLINMLSSQYNVDMERVYAVGYSNGGMMAYGLANYKSDIIAAVASVSGAMLDCIGPTSHPMPVLHLHGTSDGVLPYNGNSDWNSVQSTLDHWINFNTTITNPTVNTDSSGEITIAHYAYNQGNNGVAVEHYKYIGGDHVWFNSMYLGENTSELVWNFVSQYDLNGLR